MEGLLDVAHAWDLFAELERVEWARMPDADQEAVDWAILEEFQAAMDTDRAGNGPRRLFGLLEWIRGWFSARIVKGAPDTLFWPGCRTSGETAGARR